jgi:hypothetical protein
MMMRNGLKTFAIAAALAAGMSGAAMAQSVCPPGYGLEGGVCVPVPAAAYPSNPVSGAVEGEAAGAAHGAATGGPVGAVVGGAVGAATGTVAGTANMLSGAGTPPPAPACPPGYAFYNGACYPAR